MEITIEKKRKLVVTFKDKKENFVLRFNGNIINKIQSEGILGEGDRVVETFILENTPSLLVSKKFYPKIKISKKS